MIDQLDYEKHEGSKDGRDVRVFALSTCGFCKSCLKFLGDNDVSFKYVYYDHLDADKKNAVRDELKEKFNERVMFPYVLIDGKDVVVGFKKDKLRELLNL